MLRSFACEIHFCNRAFSSIVMNAASRSADSGVRVNSFQAPLGSPRRVPDFASALTRFAESSAPLQIACLPSESVTSRNAYARTHAMTFFYHDPNRLEVGDRFLVMVREATRTSTESVQVTNLVIQAGYSRAIATVLWAATAGPACSHPFHDSRSKWRPSRTEVFVLTSSRLPGRRCVRLWQWYVLNFRLADGWRS